MNIWQSYTLFKEEPFFKIQKRCCDHGNSFVRQNFPYFLRVIWNVEHSCDNYFGRNKIFSSSFQTHGHFPMYMLEIIYSFWFYDVFFWLWIINNSLNASQSPKLGKKNNAILRHRNKLHKIRLIFTAFFSFARRQEVCGIMAYIIIIEFTCSTFN